MTQTHHTHTRYTRKKSYRKRVIIGGANFRLYFNIRTAQHSDVEHIDIIVQGNFVSFNFRVMLFNEMYEISTIRKLPAIR